MKLNITTSPEKIISGYKNHFVENESIDLDSVINNSCQEILFANVIDKFSDEKINSVISLLISKLRLGGLIFISGTNLDIITRKFIDGSLSEVDFNKIINNSSSISSRSKIVNILKSFNLFIESSQTKGNVYEITARRK